MAGKFRGDVGKLAKKKISKTTRKSKGKRTLALVKRGKKLPAEALRSRIAQLTGESGEVSEMRIKAAVPQQQTQKLVGKAAMEIVGKRKEKVIPQTDVAPMRTPAESLGLKMLQQAVKNQSHNRLLPHQSRHDYEYRLRSIATLGVVQLFNSLAQSRKASTAVEQDSERWTADKTKEKQQVVSKEAFLAALRQSQEMQRFD